VQWDNGVGQTAVVTVLIELHDDFFRRIIAVLAENPVNERGENVVKNEGEKKPCLNTGIGMQADSNEWLQGVKHR